MLIYAGSQAKCLQKFWPNPKANIGNIFNILDLNFKVQSDKMAFNLTNINSRRRRRKMLL